MQFARKGKSLPQTSKRSTALNVSLNSVSIEKIIDVFVIALVLSKIFFLDFFGLGGIAGLIASALIIYRLCFGGWRMPLPFLALVGIGVLLVFLSILAGPWSIDNVRYNLTSILSSEIYLIYVAFLRDVNPSLIRLDGKYVLPLFNSIYFINYFVMVQQASVPYSIAAAAPSDWEISFYSDLVSGLFMYASTHAVAFFTVFVTLLNINKTQKASGSKKAIFAIVLILVIATALHISTLNDNKAVFMLLPLGVVVYFLQGLPKLSVPRFLKDITIALIAAGGIFVLVQNNRFVADFIDDNVLQLLEIIDSSRGMGSSVQGSGERIAIIQHALSLPSTWLFGLGVGAATIQQPYFEGFAHFGQADFGSVLILFGIWFFGLLVVGYAYLFSRCEKGEGKAILFCSIVLLVVVSSLYSQCFSRLNNSICLILICLIITEGRNINAANNKMVRE